MEFELALHVNPSRSSIAFGPAGAGFLPPLDSATTNYVVHFSPGTRSVDFVSMVNQGQATQQWTFNGSPLAPKSNGGSSTPLSGFIVGDNVLRIAVTAAEGITKTTHPSCCTACRTTPPWPV